MARAGILIVCLLIAVAAVLWVLRDIEPDEGVATGDSVAELPSSGSSTHQASPALLHPTSSESLGGGLRAKARSEGVSKFVIAGMVSFSDGSPASGAAVGVVPADPKDSESVLDTKADAEGRVRIVVARDVPHAVVAYVEARGMRWFEQSECAPGSLSSWCSVRTFE